jgi:hypothetical protein
MPLAHRTDNDLSTVPRFGHKDLMATSCPGLFHGMYLKGGEPWVEPRGDVEEQPDDGFVDLTPEDEQLLEQINAGKDVRDPRQDAAAVGPDEQELRAPAGDLELPPADPEFDEHLAEPRAGLETSEKRPAAR